MNFTLASLLRDTRSCADRMCPDETLKPGTRGGQACFPERKILCHPDRSIAIGFTNRNAEWRDLLELLKASMKDHCYSVYIVASKSRVIYIGMTNNLSRRAYEHKNNVVDGFSKQYRC